MTHAADATGPGFHSHALAIAPSHPPGFTRLTSEATGLVFTNQLAEERSLTNTIVNNGAGLAAGDVDGDGRCDLYFCNLDGPNALYRNLGGWRFTNITASAGVACADQWSTGAVLADVDGDGDLDLLVNSIGGGTRLFLNHGRAAFAEAHDAGLVRRFASSSMALADADGDGDLDLYVANYRTRTIMDEPGTRFTLASVQGQYVVTKVNGIPTTDPELEGRFVVGPTGTPRESGEPDVFYVNDGHGRFTPQAWTGGTFLDENRQPLKGPPRDWGLSVLFRDLNGDGAPDLYICNDADSPDRCWINDGHGRFHALPRVALRETPLSSMGADCADINRDGFDDLFMLDMLARRHEKRQTQLEKSRPPYLAPGDLESRPQYSRNTLQLNRGDGTYAEIAHLAGVQAADWAWCPVFLDVDLDGYEDLLVVNGFHLEVEDIDVADQIRSIKSARRVTPREELLMRRLFPRWDTANLAFRNRGDLTFEEAGATWGFDWVGVSQGIVLADLDNDGDLDVALNNLNQPALLYRNESAAPRVAVRLKGRSPNTQGIGARIRLHGGAVPIQHQDIQTGGRYLSCDEAVRVFAVGASTNTLRLEVLWRSGRRSTVSPVTPNRLYEIEENAAAPPPSPPAPPPATAPFFEDASQRLNHRHVEDAFDDFERQPLLPRRLSQLGPGVAWHDLNGDGWDDLILGAGRGGSPAVFLNSGQGAFNAAAIPPLQSPASDDVTTLLAWSREPGQNTLLVGIASYEAAAATNPAVLKHDFFFGQIQTSVAVPGQTSSIGPLAAADLDGDGDLDLFCGGRVVPARYPAPAASAVYRNTQGQFLPDADNSRALADAGLVSGAVWTDLDNDGFPELVLACEWGPVRLFRNSHGRLTPSDDPVTLLDSHPSPTGPPAAGETAPPDPGPQARLRLSDLTGWWTSVNAGDFDGDGRMDLVLGNWGRNTRYQEFIAGGVRLWHGDLDDNGIHDVVESYWEPRLNKEVPWRDWRTIRTAIPALADRFTTFQAYASASVQEIYGDSLQRLTPLRARTLDSMLLLNRTNHWVSPPLPIETQLAPAFASSVGDVDGDGHEDLLLSQNFFANEAEVGRFAAGRGLWLRGDGRGGFKAVPGQESGIMVYGEQRGAALSDYDGDGRPDWVVTQNGAETRLYHNLQGRPGLRVRLTGPGENGNGVGAVLRLESRGKWGPAREVHLGAGYWSQDSAVQVLPRPAGDTRIQVRWPGGRTTASAIPPDAMEVQVTAAGELTVLR